MHKYRFLLSAFAALFLLLCDFNAFAANINDIRVWNSPDRTRIVFDLSGSVEYKFFELKNPNRIVIDISDSKFTGQLPKSGELGNRVSKIRTGKHDDLVRFVFDLKSVVRAEHFTLIPIENYGDRLVLDLYAKLANKQQSKPKKVDDEFIVVLDAGHGGEDPGAVGAAKTLEKHLVLKIAKQLKIELNKVKGIRAELTRKGDYYISLRKRRKIAADLNADLFVSIHADAFTKRSANGISVFALSQHGATSERARLVAQKENSADFVAGENLSQKDRDVAETVVDLSYQGQINRSVALGSMVRTRLSRVGRLHGHGVEQAGFAVLKAPDIPSILVEVGFISNPKEERSLNKKSYQKKIVKEIATGVVQYAKKYPWGQEKWRTSSIQ